MTSMNYQTSTSSYTSSPPTSPPAGVSMLDHFMQQARARVEARMQSPSTATPQSHRTTTDPHSIVQENIRIDVENELCIERCIALTEDCLARARAFLAQPNKLPERLSRPVETAERRRSSGRQLTRPTAKAVGLQSRRAYDDAQTRLRLQEARRTALPPSSRGAATEAASRDGMSLHSGSESEELEFAQASSTGDDPSVSEVANGEAHGWHQVAGIEVEFRWDCTIQ